MHLLHLQDDGELSLVKCSGNGIPRYAILSHIWGSDDDEVTFQDITSRSGKSKAGYRKIRFCGKQAKQDGLQHFWVDTCCIDKSSSAELSEAIISMFRWYKGAAKCYVYLSDVSINNFAVNSRCFQESRWFKRGWTLQELLAPTSIEFFSQELSRLGDKDSLMPHIVEVTGIPSAALRGSPLSQFSLKARASWLGERQTKREEDRAYCLLGILDVQMVPLYGEGQRMAFKRLLGELSKFASLLGHLCASTQLTSRLT
ncbi:HET-domain-containing protein [Ophiobolus disseminans]|uniref:HET-domain-containing protein n=1 Tax=Ophiobolus disseminans TaxID=1469910 RepID=A0A6A6ZB13_9PLEO|nr:HET-domain-containing protein [Ophiobolus disseminans]